MEASHKEVVLFTDIGMRQLLGWKTVIAHKDDVYYCMYMAIVDLYLTLF